MKYLKILIVVIALVALAKYFPMIYYTSQFKEVVEVETNGAKAVKEIRESIANQAQLLFIPVRQEDINIKENGPDVKVTVDYVYPVNLFVYTHKINFHAAAAAKLPQQ